jgi:hypothetical protein
MSVQRHKESGHVAEALALYETEMLPYRLDVTRIFHRNVQRLGKAQDAADEWLTDPEDPERYFLGARAEEVTIVYEATEPDENARSGFRTVRRKAKLHVLLDGIQERHGIRVTGFETKFSDPRDYLLKSSEQLRGELTLFLQSLTVVEAREEREAAARLAAVEHEAEAAALLTEALAPWLAEDLAASFDGTLDVETGRRLAEKAAPALLARILERMRGGG